MVVVFILLILQMNVGQYELNSKIEVMWNQDLTCQYILFCRRMTQNLISNNFCVCCSWLKSDATKNVQKSSTRRSRCYDVAENNTGKYNKLLQMRSTRLNHYLNVKFPPIFVELSKLLQPLVS